MSDDGKAGKPGDVQLPSRGDAPTELEPSQVPPEERARPEGSELLDGASRVLRDILSGSALLSVLAVILALIAGGILIVLTDSNVQATAGYFFSRPSDTVQAVWNSLSGAYSALFQGAIYNFGRPTFAQGIRPLTETLTFATPLIVAGLGLALGFRVGLFNIGGQGQILAGAAAAGWVGFSFDLPFPLHMIVAILAGLVAGGLAGGLVGVLKARTGAHEVIVTIMLNYVILYLISYFLDTPKLLQAPGSNNPKTPAEKGSAIFPLLFGPQYRLSIGFILAIIATIVVWYLINRSNLGFQFRAVGENANAARVAGINVKNVYVWALVISGALVALAGVQQVLGNLTTGFSADIDAGIGFSAITVALLGRSKPVGVFFAGILFGALQAGGYAMQAGQNIPVDIVLVVQSLIVLFIAAPPLVRAIFHLPAPGPTRRKVPRTSTQKAVVAK
ncbi:MAG: ral nucleoside transport system permease protein [Actinomycetota bacterium]|nr:ral nucleoside transport system permease protein [Actinomycetota bacterium]